MLEEISKMRLSGKADEAFDAVLGLIRGNPPTVSGLMELVKLSILTERNEVAHRAYTALKKITSTDQRLEAEVLVRLSISLGLDLNPDFVSLGSASRSRWVDQYVEDKTDILFDTKILSCLVLFDDHQCGRYLFGCQCNSCNSEYSLKVSTSFLLYREFLCPDCLSRQVVEYDILKSFFEKKYAPFLGSDVDALDGKLKLSEMEIEDALIGRGSLPLLSKVFYHDNTITLNRMVLNHLCTRLNEGRGQ